MITLYGIPNCDTIKKARNWMNQHSINYQFHDFKKDGLDKTKLTEWIDQQGWETIINKRSTTWRQLDDATKKSMDSVNAIAVALENPSIIKRPVLEINNICMATGFKPDNYLTLLCQK